MCSTPENSKCSGPHAKSPNLLFPSLKYFLFSPACLLAIPEKKELTAWQHLSSKMPPHYSTRDQSSLLDRIIAGLPGGLAAQVQRLWDRQSYSSVSTHGSRIPRSLRNAQRWNPRRLLSLPHLFVLLWLVLLLWGERWAFERAVSACEWRKWESWVSITLGMKEDETLMRRCTAKRSNAASSGLHRGSATQ